MDLSDSIQANSEQVNADDLLSGPVTSVITGVEAGTADQPVFIHLAAFPGRTFRPAKTVRRILVHIWGKESSVYVGRSITIYNDADVKWGGQSVGGVRISHASDIDGPQTIPLTTSRGKKSPFKVLPLVTRDFLAELELAGKDVTALEALGKAARHAGAAPTILDVIRAAYQKAKDAT